MIYIVTSGSYSDYGINAVFTDKALASLYINAFGDEEFQIEEFEENPYTDQLKNGCIAFQVNMEENGTFFVKRTSDYRLTAYKEPYSMDGWYYDGEGIRHDVLNLRMDVLAMDQEHALKIVNEKRGQLIANNLFHK